MVRRAEEDWRYIYMARTTSLLARAVSHDLLSKAEGGSRIICSKDQYSRSLAQTKRKILSV